MSTIVSSVEPQVDPAVTHTPHERRDNPMFCPIMNAFKEMDIEKPENLFSPETRHFKEPLAVQWKPGCLPFFRRQVNHTIYSINDLDFFQGILKHWPFMCCAEAQQML